VRGKRAPLSQTETALAVAAGVAVAAVAAGAAAVAVPALTPDVMQKYTLNAEEGTGPVEERIIEYERKLPC
jgi:predicted nicotinamide N-methyase